MTRKYSLVVEGDEAGYSAYVPELPTILVTGRTLDELSSRAEEAIGIYWESIQGGHGGTRAMGEFEAE